MSVELIYAADGLLLEWAKEWWGMVTPSGMAVIRLQCTHMRIRHIARQRGGPIGWWSGRSDQ